MAGGGSCALWFMGDGEGRSSLWLVVVTCEWVCCRGRLWAVVEFVAVGGDVVGARCCSCWCCGAHIVACGHLWAVVVVVVTGW